MKRALWTLAVLLSHWRRHPMQLATLLIGLISATALWSGVQALNQQARTSYDRAAATFGGSRTAMLVAPQRRKLSARALRRPAPRRLAGLAGARGPDPDRGPLVPAAGHRAGDAARGSRQRACDRQGRSAILHDAAGRDAGCTGNACRSQARRGRAPRRPMAAHCCRRFACSRTWCPAYWSSTSALRRAS